jgi:2-polyprenyl-6-methoxyphenol hydroxylase-like FAD-dependent oxidoreductase
MRVDIERGAKLTAFSEDENSVRATIEHNGGRVEEAESAYICGCDGARSCVRETLKIGFVRATLLRHGREDRARLFLAISISTSANTSSL